MILQTLLISGKEGMTTTLTQDCRDVVEQAWGTGHFATEQHSNHCSCEFNTEGKATNCRGAGKGMTQDSGVRISLGGTSRRQSCGEGIPSRRRCVQQLATPEGQWECQNGERECVCAHTHAPWLEVKLGSDGKGPWVTTDVLRFLPVEDRRDFSSFNGKKRALEKGNMEDKMRKGSWGHGSWGCDVGSVRAAWMEADGQGKIWEISERQLSGYGCWGRTTLLAREAGQR